MILILEGSDCTGKTTYAKMLSEKLGFEILKGSYFEISELGACGMYKHMMDLLDNDNIIIDRFMHSNLVYGELFKYPMMTDSQYDDLIDKLDEYAILVYLHAPKGTIEYRIENRGDDMIKSENANMILEKYKDVMYGDFRPKFMLSIDTSIFDIEQATDLIVNIVKNN